MGKGNRVKRQKAQQRLEQQRQNERLRSLSMFHGGAPGLDVGDVLTKEHWSDPRELAGDLGMPSELIAPGKRAVYITSDALFAASFAAKKPLGDLYRVEPHGEIGPDPDFADHKDLSFACESATILEVLHRQVKPTRENRLAGSRAMTWSDGGAIYDEDGFMLPSKIMEAHGITRAHLRSYGFLPDIEAVDEDLRRRAGI